MLISIVIPVYNVEKYIEKCLLSVIPQLNSEVEVIIVNDGTPDNSMEIVERLVAGQDNIRIISQHNQGLSAARNTGLSKATGDYIWFVDSDDSLLDNAIHRVLCTIQENPGIDVISTVLFMKDEKTEETKWEWKPIKTEYDNKEYLFAGYNTGAVQRYILRRGFLLDNKLEFMPGIYHEDGEFAPRMLYLANRIYLMESPVYVYLVRTSGSIMSSRKPKMNYDLVTIYHSLDRFCEESVKKEDYWRFKQLMFKTLMCSVSFSIEILETSDFKDYWKKNKKFIKRKAREMAMHPGCMNLRAWINVCCCSFIPLTTERLKKKVIG